MHSTPNITHDSLQLLESNDSDGDGAGATQEGGGLVGLQGGVPVDIYENDQAIGRTIYQNDGKFAVIEVSESECRFKFVPYVFPSTYKYVHVTNNRQDDDVYTNDGVEVDKNVMQPTYAYQNVTHACASERENKNNLSRNVASTAWDDSDGADNDNESLASSSSSEGSDPWSYSYSDGPKESRRQPEHQCEHQCRKATSSSKVDKPQVRYLYFFRFDVLFMMMLVAVQVMQNRLPHYVIFFCSLLRSKQFLKSH